MLIPTYIAYAAILCLFLIAPAIGIFCVYTERCCKKQGDEEPKETSEARVILVMPADCLRDEDPISHYDDLPPSYHELFPSCS
ncbi:unnamed protein product, partial [Mesorhabditis belari]|uniref:Uncharacterized protein n=1 Tax=Mesorhabditis belari TaxID=2138241 RepID=A0AAF3FDH3_9BILA